MKLKAPTTICFLLIITLTGCTIVRQHSLQKEYKDELDLTKALLVEVIENDHPSIKWHESIGKLLKRNPDESFYSLKVWFVYSGTARKDIESSTVVFAFRDEHMAGLVLKYKKNEPELSFNIYDEGEKKTIDAYFSLNNCLFDPDFNRDGKVDEYDVEQARSTKRKT